MPLQVTSWGLQQMPSVQTSPLGQQVPLQQACPGLQQSWPQTLVPCSQPQVPSLPQEVMKVPQQAPLQIAEGEGQHRLPLSKQVSVDAQVTQSPPQGLGRHPPCGRLQAAMQTA